MFVSHNKKQQNGTALLAGESDAPGSEKSSSGRLLSRESSFSAQEHLRVSSNLINTLIHPKSVLIKLG